MIRIVSRDVNIDFVGKRFHFILLSLIIIVAGMLEVVLKGGLKYGIDFSGGIIVQVKFNKNKPTMSDLRKKMKKMEKGTVIIQDFESSSSEFLIKIQKLEKEDPASLADRIVKSLKKQYKENNLEIRRIETVGARVGKDLKERGILSVIFAIIGMLIYITWRFEFSFGLGAIIALVHDVLISLTAISIGGKDIDLVIIAALLTIVGYSVNDTIVVYDRIRENIRKMKKNSLPEVVNKSINETLSRTILTSLTTLIMVLALFIFGGGIVHDFAFVLLVGIITGTYSSIFIASPVVLFLRKSKK